MLRTTNGFTLIEIAIVLVIVGLLLGGLLMPLAAQVEVRRHTETQKILKEINEAMIGFALVNGRLPCPAAPGTPTGTVGAGLERAVGVPPVPTCPGANALGVVPWVTLGVSEVDAWGRRFTYRVTDWYSDRILALNTVQAPLPAPQICVGNPTNASFALCSPGDMDIRVGPALALVATRIPAVIVSHGKNGRGGYLPNGNQMTCPAVPPPVPAPPPPTPEEIENADCPTNNPLLFISHEQTSSSAAVGEFDDIVSWVVPASLMKGMVDAGRLP